MWFLFACMGGSPSSGDAAPSPRERAPADVQEHAEAAPAAVEVPDAVAIRHILIGHEDSASAPRARTSDEAHEIASALRQRILEGEDMRELAFAHSDDVGNAKRGGWLGVGEEGTWVPEFTTAAFSLDVGELSAPVQTPFGWHVLRREDHTRVVLMHLVIRHAESPETELARAGERTLAEAEEIAASARTRILAGEAFADVARELSDGPYAAEGGALGEFLIGELGPDVDVAVAETPPGELSQVFVTPHGAHLIFRAE